MTLKEAEEELVKSKKSFTSDNINYDVCIVPSNYDEMTKYLTLKKNNKDLSPLSFSSNQDFKLIGWWTDGVNVMKKSI